MNKPRLAAILLMLVVGAATGAGKPPDQEIRDATDQLQNLVRQHHGEYRADSAKFYAMVDRVVVPHFDEKYIGQIVLGRNWRGATPAQRDRFIAAFKNSLVHSYADAILDNYDSVRADWKPVHLAPDASDGVVNATLQRRNGPPIQLGFSVRKLGDEWKVYDVVVDGISLAANFRSQFAAEIKQNGLDALIARLERGEKPLKNEQAIKRR